MSAPTLLVQLDNKAVPLTECSWGQFAPCGCMNGITMAATDYRVIADEESAWRYMYEGESKILLERDRRAGFTMRLVGRDAAKQLLVKCDHDPQWGIPPRPQPEGMVWGIPRRWDSRKSDRLHLIPAEANQGKYGQDHTALCGKKDDGWSSEWHDAHGHPDCVKCTRAAGEVSP